MKEETQQRRIFVCVKDRGADGTSCAASGSRALITSMREALDRESIPSEELDVRPCGCLGLCSQGPVFAAVVGEGAAERKPAKLPRKKKRRANAGAYVKVERDELRGILRETLAKPLHAAS
jgi:NADH:ubiquinone oxidoreductase subunit E